MKTRSVLTLSAAIAVVLGLSFALPAAAMPAAQDAAHEYAKHEDHATHDPDAHEHANHDQHQHDAKTHAEHHGHAAAMPVADDHVKWEPDAPLMEGMQRVSEAMTGLDHHEMGHLNETQVDQLATQVDEAVAYMFANCELDAEPDVALHGVLARFMAGAEALHADPADPAPVANIRAALEDYPKLFDDPTFAEADAAAAADAAADDSEDEDHDGH